MRNLLTRLDDFKNLYRDINHITDCSNYPVIVDYGKVYQK